MKADDLRFQWDPHANRKSSIEKNSDDPPAEMKSLEDYLEFIEQFNFTGNEGPLEQHVDIKFRLEF